MKEQIRVENELSRKSEINNIATAQELLKKLKKDLLNNSNPLHNPIILSPSYL